MVRAMVLWLWTSFMLVVKINGVEVDENIGVNWGTIASHTLHPQIIVNMLIENGIKRVKLFDASDFPLFYLAGTGIEVMVAIPNDMLQRMNKYSNAEQWVQKNITRHIYIGGVDIKYVAVGNEPFLSSYNESYKETTFPALKNIAKALEEAGHKKIKASIPLNADVYESSSTSPSSGDFRKDVRDTMVEILEFLKKKKAPFIVNIYPFLSLSLNSNFPEEFAFFDGGKVIHDNGKSYSNVFDANFDTLVSALKKHGHGDMEIIVGEVGWPTDGHPKANIKNAMKFYDGLFKKLASDKGTPLRPGVMQVYLFGLMDENLKSIDPGDFERHWGIFRYDGQPKFPMDFSGRSNDKMPIGAQGVEYLESKWCVYNPEAKDKDKVAGAIDYACSRSDCTALNYGSSCNNLNKIGNISYAFNIYFQMNDQSVEACDFEGLAMITSTNASKNTCLFPIQIATASINFISVVQRLLLGIMLLLSVFL